MIDFVFTCVIAQHRRQLYCIIRGVDGSFIDIDINYIRPRYYTHKSRCTASINEEEFMVRDW